MTKRPKKFFGSIIFGFEFYCKWIIAIRSHRGNLRTESLRCNRIKWGTGMKPTRSQLHRTERQREATGRRRLRYFPRDLAVSAFVTLSACEQNSFVPPPPPKVDVGLPVQRTITRYLEATGNTAPIKTVDLVATGAGRAAIDQLSGRHPRQGRHDAVHDRARDLQAEARAGAGGRGRRAGVAEAGRSRLQAPVGSGCQAGRLAGDARYVHLRRATTPRPTCSRPRSTPRSPRSITATPRWSRRSTASSARIWSRSANSSARRRRPSSPPSCSSIRST